MYWKFPEKSLTQNPLGFNFLNLKKYLFYLRFFTHINLFVRKIPRFPRKISRSPRKIARFPRKIYLITHKIPRSSRKISHSPRKISRFPRKAPFYPLISRYSQNSSFYSLIPQSFPLIPLKFFLDKHSTKTVNPDSKNVKVHWIQIVFLLTIT